MPSKAANSCSNASVLHPSKAGHLCRNALASSLPKEARSQAPAKRPLSMTSINTKWLSLWSFVILRYILAGTLPSLFNLWSAKRKHLSSWLPFSFSLSRLSRSCNKSLQFYALNWLSDIYQKRAIIPWPNAKVQVTAGLFMVMMLSKPHKHMQGISSYIKRQGVVDLKVYTIIASVWFLI